MAENKHRGQGGPASLDGIAQDMPGNTAQWTIDEQRIYVAGIFSGGGAAASLAADFKRVLTAPGWLAGLSADRRTAATPPLGRRRAPRRRSEVLTFSARDSIDHSRTATGQRDRHRG